MLKSLCAVNANLLMAQLGGYRASPYPYLASAYITTTSQSRKYVLCCVVTVKKGEIAEPVRGICQDVAVACSCHYVGT